MSNSDGEAIVNINTISYGKNKLFKVTIPPIMIPASIRNHIISNAQNVWDTKKKYIDLGLENKEVKERLKQYKKDNDIRDLFAVFIKIGDSRSTVLSFITGHNKQDYTKNDTERRNLTSKSINEISSQFNKEVFILKSSNTKSTKSQVSSEIIDNYKNTIKYLFDKLVALNTMMGADDKFEMLDLEDDDEDLIGEIGDVMRIGIDKLIAGESINE
ncbi:MAG: hypothetical protein ACFFDB_00180 [Promethearchaeota archaeon]